MKKSMMAAGLLTAVAQIAYSTPSSSDTYFDDTFDHTSTYTLFSTSKQTWLHFLLKRDTIESIPINTLNTLKNLILKKPSTGACTQCNLLLMKELDWDEQKDWADFYNKLLLNPSSPDALCCLGFMHEQGLGVDQDNTAAIDYYDQAVKQQHSLASVNRAIIHTHNKEEEQAAALYRSAANGNHPCALNQLAGRHIKGDNRCIEPDPERGFSLLKIAAKQGYPRAQCNLGALYCRKKNAIMAAYWYHRAAKQGDPRGQFITGLLFIDGDENSANGNQASRWLTLSAQQGYSEACLQLGQLYFQGKHGFPEDHTLAMKWLTHPNLHNNGAACYWIGKIHIKKKEHALAFNSFQRGAGFGHPLSQLETGKMARDGLGTPPSLKDADRWFTRAAETSTNAKKELAELHLSHPTRDLVKAQQLFLELKSIKPFKVYALMKLARISAILTLHKALEQLREYRK